MDKLEKLKMLENQINPDANNIWVLKNIEPLNLPKVGDLKGKTLFISGASRGIGLQIALKAAKDGANLAIAAKTVTPHPKLAGTIFTAQEDIKKAGGNCIAIQCDIRDEESVKKAVEETVKAFGGIDILVNNASALFFSSVEETNMK